MRLIFIFLLTSLFTGVKAQIVSRSIYDTDTLPHPLIDVSIKLNSDSFTTKNNIVVDITLTNKTEILQKVWFDQPKLSTGGPAYTWVKLINKTLGTSPLKYESSAILISQACSIDVVKTYLQPLKSGESISKKYALNKLAIFTSPDLEKGIYEMSIIYWNNRSNTVNFTIY